MFLLLAPKYEQFAGSSWSVSWRITANSSRTETSTSTSRCSSLGRRMSRRRRSTTSSSTSLSRCPSWMLPLCSVDPFCQVTYKDFVSTALQLPEVLTCREDLPKVSSSLELVIDQEEPPIKAWSVVREYGNDQAMLSIVPFKKLLITIANSFFVLWNILQPCRICILISAVWLVSQQVNINVLKVICEQTSPDTSGEVCWPTLSRWCALCTRLALIIALPLPIVQCLAGICPLLASISVKGGPSHLLSKFHFH